MQDLYEEILLCGPALRSMCTRVHMMYLPFCGSTMSHQLSSPPLPSSNISSTYAFASSSPMSPEPSALIHHAIASLTSRGIAFDDLSGIRFLNNSEPKYSPGDINVSPPIDDPLLDHSFIPADQVLYVCFIGLISAGCHFNARTQFPVVGPLGRVE